LSEDQNPEIPDDVQTFLRDHASSYEELETLLLLHGSREKTWSLDDVAACTRLPADEVRAVLDTLCEAGFARQVEGGFRYAAAGNETVDRLARAYDEDRLSVVMVMAKNGLERVRAVTLRAFADAFVIGRKKRDG
jgi:hypothetical protein